MYMYVCEVRFDSLKPMESLLLHRHKLLLPFQRLLLQIKSHAVPSVDKVLLSMPYTIMVLFVASQ